MGGQAPIPTSTQSFQAYTPNDLDWANFKLKKQLQNLQMQYYQPLLEDTLERRSLYKGIMGNDPESLRKFVGLPSGASPERVNALVKRSFGVASNVPKQVLPTNTQTAAKGGIMQLRKFAPGGSTETPEAKFKRLEALAASGKKLTPTQQAYRKNYSATVASGGTPSLSNGKVAVEKTKPPVLKPAPKNETPEQRYNRLMDFENAGGKLNATQQQYVSNYNEYDDNIEKGGYSIDYKTGMPVAPKLPSNATKAERDAANKKFSDATGLQVGDNGKVTPIEGWTPPVTPGEEGAGEQAPITESGAIGGLTPGVSPKLDANGNIDWTQSPDYTNPWINKSLDYLNQMQAPSEWGQAGSMYNTAAQGLQSLAGYTPQQVAYSNAAAERASAERMAAIADVQASQMQRPEDVQAQRLERYQMEGKVPEVTTKDLEAYQMAGPGSWTEEGVSQKYMSPYMQGVIDISKREAERDYLKQANALNAKAISAGAFGGSRQALERSEAQRNYNQQLQDMQVKGLQQAYESGRSQYGQELNLSQQTALQNLQSKLSTQSQSAQQQLQAMLSNQNIDYQTKVQNLQAMLGVQSQEAQQMLQAALANQQVAFGTGQTNAQLAQQAALANQQTQFGVGSLNANLGTQANMQNAQLGTQVNLANAQNALQAGMANQQAGLQGNAQNIGAYNAMGNMAQGIAGIGNNRADYNQKMLGNYGTAAGLTQDLWTQGYTNYTDAQKTGVGTANPAPKAIS